MSSLLLFIDRLLSVCLSVCHAVRRTIGLLKQLWIKFHEIVRR